MVLDLVWFSSTFFEDYGQRCFDFDLEVVFVITRSTHSGQPVHSGRLYDLFVFIGGYIPVLIAKWGHAGHIPSYALS